MSSVRRLKYCVNGEWKDSSTKKFMPVTNSSTGEVIAEAPCCTVEEVNSAVEAAAVAFGGDWANTPVAERTQVMFRFKTKLEEHLDELTLSVSKELGKTWKRLEATFSRRLKLWSSRAPFLSQCKEDPS